MIDRGLKDGYLRRETKKDDEIEKMCQILKAARGLKSIFETEASQVDFDADKILKKIDDCWKQVLLNLPGLAEKLEKLKNFEERIGDDTVPDKEKKEIRKSLDFFYEDDEINAAITIREILGNLKDKLSKAAELAKFDKNGLALKISKSLNNTESVSESEPVNIDPNKITKIVVEPFNIVVFFEAGYFKKLKVGSSLSQVVGFYIPDSEIIVVRDGMMPAIEEETVRHERDHNMLEWSFEHTLPSYQLERVLKVVRPEWRRLEQLPRVRDDVAENGLNADEFLDLLIQEMYELVKEADVRGFKKDSTVGSEVVKMNQILDREIRLTKNANIKKKLKNFKNDFNDKFNAIMRILEEAYDEAYDLCDARESREPMRDLEMALLLIPLKNYEKIKDVLKKMHAIS